MSKTINAVKEDFVSAQEVLTEFCADQGVWDRIETIGNLLVDTLRKGNKIFSCGNGGSHCDAMHFAEELSGRYRKNRPALAALAISDVSHITCVANDFGYDMIFARYLEAIGKKGDAIILFTSSGNSENLIRAAEKAKELGILVIGFTGNYGGVLATLCDQEIRVPYVGYADRIQEIHIKLVHALIHYIETKFGY